ncbi:MAG: NAD-dependent epimerase/dehydratase family protein [Acidimicrobiales bacterium]
MRLLVLGGTAFLGRAVVQEAVGLGHQVTLFNRGVTSPELFAEVEKLRGDRGSDLSALDGRRWDAVIDVAAYTPDEAKRSTEVLRGRVGRYVFVSTISVYADHATTEAQLEDGALLVEVDAEDPGVRYGARKAACEAMVRTAFPDACSIARSGLIVGPHDPTDRFAYWPRRMAAGGRVLGPGHPEDPLQVIDVRDLAWWLVRCADGGPRGIFNVTGVPLPFAALLDACRVGGVEADVVWVASDRLVEAGLAPWMGVPLWITGAGWEAHNTVSVERALASGLDLRPLADTVAGARAHMSEVRAPFTETLEAEILERFA